MNPTQVGGLFRDAVKALGLAIVGIGIVPGGSWIEIAAGLAFFVGSSYWSYHTNSTPSQLAAVSAPAQQPAAVAAMAAAPAMRDNVISIVAATQDQAGGVKAVVMNSNAVANAIPSNNVVGPQHLKEAA